MLGHYRRMGVRGEGCQGPYRTTEQRSKQVSELLVTFKRSCTDWATRRRPKLLVINGPIICWWKRHLVTRCTLQHWSGAHLPVSGHFPLISDSSCYARCKICVLEAWCRPCVSKRKDTNFNIVCNPSVPTTASVCTR
jgi:hypothetical protein